MGKLLRRVAWIGLVLLALFAGWGTYAVRGSLATLDGEHLLAGLSAPAAIERDSEGVVTITAANAVDASRALGFVHAQERYFEMDLLRRSAAGELAELFGPVALPSDRSTRTHRMRARMRQALADLEPSQRAAADAYVAGVQTGLAALRNRPWPYLLLRQRPQPWLPEDSLLAAAAMAFDLHDESNRREYMLARLDQHLSAEIMTLLGADGSEWDAPLMGEPRPPVVLPPGPQLAPASTSPAAHEQPESLVPVEGAVDGVGTGSNSFAVAGQLTADGRALLANDMHLGLRAPNIWFRARLRYPDPRAASGAVDVSGFSLPGVPGIVVGSNGHVAWGFTNSYGDWLDWVRVEWSDREGGRYRTLDGERPLQMFDEVIAVAGGASATLRVRETRWGPILHEPTDAADPQPTLALLWTVHRPGGLDLGLIDMAHAESLDAALAVGQRLGMPAQNLLVADRAGRIGWTIAGRLPTRLGDCDAQRPLDPLAGCEWADGWIDPAQAPRLSDPADGRLWTANSRVADADALRLIGNGGYDLGARQQQIRDALRGTDQFDESTLLAIQLDSRALFLQRWWHLLRDVASSGTTPELVRLERASRNWEGQAGVDAVSYRLARGFRGLVIERVTGALLAEARSAEAGRWQEPVLTQFEAVAWRLLQERPDGWLAEASGGWDSLLQATATELVVQLEVIGPLADRTWGKRNTARICHPLAAALPKQLADLLCLPFDPLPGDSHMPRVQGPGFGASQRMVVAPGFEADGIIHAPAGQSGHPLSPFWSAGHRAWVDGAATPFLPGQNAHRLELRP